MADNLPSGPRIDREALERIIRRAAELQAGEKDIGEGLTDQELYQLGQDVGIGDRYLRQALLEERTRAAVEPQQGLLVWLAGPRRVAASRTIPRSRREAEEALQSWMAEGELLQVKRRYPEQTTWEAQQGAYASLKRAFGSRGRRYTLARAREVAGAITEVDERNCHVQLVADISNSLNQQVSGGMVVGITGLAATTVALTLGVMAPVATVPVIVCGTIAFALTRRHRTHAEETLVALEQVLDRLEHGEAEQPSPLLRAAEEIRRTLGA